MTVKINDRQISILENVANRLDYIAVEVGTLHEIEDGGVVEKDDIQEQIEELEECINELKTLQNGL